MSGKREITSTVNWNVAGDVCHIYIGNFCVADICGCENMSEDEVKDLVFEILDEYDYDTDSYLQNDSDTDEDQESAKSEVEFEEVNVGTIDFSGIIDITDPCYDEVCRGRINNVPVIPGTYTCKICLRNETDGTTEDTRVAKISICHSDYELNPDDSFCLGSIGVDAGLAGFFENKQDYNDREWERFCDHIIEKDNENAWIYDNGFFSSSGYGDGVYDVTVYNSDKGYYGAEISFIYIPKDADVKA